MVLVNLKQYAELKVSDYFGENALLPSVLSRKLPPSIFSALERAINRYEQLPREVGDAVAVAMKDWALEKGAGAYTHWFQPLTGLTAEKHESFISPSKFGWCEQFSGAKLIKSEPDASSFPHGGMRSTFEARGYAAWDPSSPAFIMQSKLGRTLYIPSVFVSYDGHVLDKKTPLIKSIKAVSEAAKRLVSILNGGSPDWIYPYAGAEQEYFLVDSRLADKRPDLSMLGYTLFGAKTPKGQQFGDHYFGSIRERVLTFMQELEIELFRLGIPAKTRHNEVAPNQFELTAIHEKANIAADHNQLVMEMLRRVSRRHGLTALLHEKPFAGINGSGKHTNWSLMNSRGENMFSPGTDRRSNLRFLCFISAILEGVALHGDLLRSIISSPGNDLRLGSHEAPPGVMSVFLGEALTGILRDIESGTFVEPPPESAFLTGVPFIPPFPMDSTDRNRTSPIAFTGNKFEFRAVGSSASIAMPLAVLNTLAADGIHRLCSRLETSRDPDTLSEHAVLNAIKAQYAESARIHYEGDNYSGTWLQEAARRELVQVPHTPGALKFLVDERNIKLFDGFHILNRHEITARYQIKIDTYIKTVELELRTVRNMLRTMIIPPVMEYESMVNQAYINFQAVTTDPVMLKTRREFVAKLSRRLQNLLEKQDDMNRVNRRMKELENEEKAVFCAEVIRPLLEEVRRLVDEIEERIDARFWRLPGYWKMLSGL